jgi:LacI family transcriptional regulator
MDSSCPPDSSRRTRPSPGTPALTTVRQLLAEMGRMAVGLLVCMRAEPSIETLHVELGTTLVVRESTAPLS